MPDYKRTEEPFKAEGISHLYKKPSGQQDERFYSQVTHPQTGSFYKLSDLPLEYRQNKKEIPYPIRGVYQIIRIKRMDGTEWLKSRGRIVGLDRLGNEVEHSFTDPEIFYKPSTKYEMKDRTRKTAQKVRRESVLQQA